jgi:hypothetical protein
VVAALASACADLVASGGARAWMEVARDSSYTIAIDTARIARRSGADYVIWYRTDHAVTRAYKGHAFDREIVESTLDCYSLRFKISSVAMSRRGHLVAVQRTESGDLAQQPWHKVERGTIEETVARAACDVARRQYTARAR